MRFFFNGLVALGVLFGVLLVIAFEFFSDFFGKSFEPSGELVAAILGASIGWAGTVLTIHASIEAREDEQLARDKAVSAEIFVKFQSMINNLYSFRKHLRDCYENVDPECHERPGLFVLSLAGHPDPIIFTPEEKALYLRLKRIDAANDLAQWDDIYNSLLKAFEKYGIIREKFMAETPAMMVGMVGTTSVTPEEFSKIGPTIAQLNDLASQLRERSERDYSECRSALLRVKSEMEALCGVKIDLIFPD